MRILATIKNHQNGKTTTVHINAPLVHGGMWTISERARRAAFKRIGMDWRGPIHPSITADRTIRSIDKNGYGVHTTYARAI